MLGSIHWTLNKSSKVLNDDSVGIHEKGSGTTQISDHSLAKVFMESTEVGEKKSCSICDSSTPALPDSSVEESSGDGNGENSLAIVPVKATTGADREVVELKPGWPLLHRKILSDRKISVVQWAMRLPSRNLSYAADHDHKTNDCDRGEDRFLGLDSKSGALVLVDAEIGTAASPECNSRSMPKELEGLHEKYSSTCRLFNYQELLSATSNFLPGVYFLFGTQFDYMSSSFHLSKSGFVFDMVVLF